MKRFFATAAAALLLGGAVFAFAAVNSVPTSYAGDGTAAIEGYEVSNIHYTLRQESGGAIAIDDLQFDLNHPVTRVVVEAQATAWPYRILFTNGPIGGIQVPGANTAAVVESCTLTGQHVRCLINGNLVPLTMTSLRVVAVV